MGFVAIACLVVYHYGYIHNLVRDHNLLVEDIKDAKSFIAELQEQIESLQPEEEYYNPLQDHPQEAATEWTQIAAWVAWAWVGLTTVIAILGVLAVLKGEPSNIEYEADRIEHAKVTDMALSVAKAFALNAILGLMLIQTLGLTVQLLPILARAEFEKKKKNKKFSNSFTAG